MTLQRYSDKIAHGHDLTMVEMTEAAHLLFDEATGAQEITQFLLLLGDKGETAEEIAALALVMRANAVQIDVPEGIYIDNCGTGGDGLQSFNVSTATAFVLAGASVLVAKHGNRKVSSAAGSSDVLEALGIRLLPTASEAAELLALHGIAFLHAPHMHPKLKRISAIRQAIGKPTIFNLVGPLTNPVPLATQLVGINRPHFTTEYARALHLIGRKRAIVVSGAYGMDEASLEGENTLALLDDGDIVPFKLAAQDIGLQSAEISAIRGGDAEENAHIMHDLLQGEESAYLNTVLLNAAIALFAYGTCRTIEDGLMVAKQSITSKRAMQKLHDVIAYSKEKEQTV